MTVEFCLNLGQRALETAFLLSLPVLLVALVVGFLVSMGQAVTSIRDMTTGLVIKLASVGITLLIFGGWMTEVAVDFTMEMFGHMQMVGK